MELDLCDFGLLRVPTRPEYFWCARDDELWHAILQQLVKVWEYVQRRELPPPERVVDFKSKFPTAVVGSYVPYQHETMHDRLERYQEITEIQSGLKTEKEAIRDSFITELGADEGIAIMGDGDPEPVATWTSKKGARKFSLTPRGKKLFHKEDQ
jgi:hypothetical protein